MPVFDPPVFDPPVFEGDEESPSGASHTNWVTLDCECPCSDGFSGSGPIDVICENGTPRTIPAYMNGTLVIDDPTLAIGCIWPTMCCTSTNCIAGAFPWENGRTYSCRRIHVEYYTVGPFSYPAYAIYTLGTLSTREAFASVGAPDPLTWGCWGADGDTYTSLYDSTGYPFWEYIGVCEITPGLPRTAPVYYIHHFISVEPSITICPGEFFVDGEVVSRTCMNVTVRHMTITYIPEWDDLGTPVPESWGARIQNQLTCHYTIGSTCSLDMYTGTLYPGISCSVNVCYGDIYYPTSTGVFCGSTMGLCDDDNWNATIGPDMFCFSGCDDPQTWDHNDGTWNWSPG